MRFFKALTVSAVLASALIVISTDASAERAVRRTARAKTTTLADVCTKITPLGGMLIKVTAGGHISGADARNSGYSLICGSSCASLPANIYHCDGSLAFRVGYYGRYAENGRPRAYCAAGGAPACYVTRVRARSKALKCNGAGYLDLDGRLGKKCYRFNLNSSRNGDV